MAEIEIVPSAVTVGVDATQQTTFMLEARLWTGPPGRRSSILESAGVKVKWTVSPSTSWLQLVGSPDGYHAKLIAEPGPTPSTPVVVKAEADGRVAESRIDPATVSDQDQVKASYSADMSPDALVMHGKADGSVDPCSVWLPAALVRSGLAGKATAGCGADDPSWALAVLDPAHAGWIHLVGWTPTVDVVDASPPVAVRSIPVAVRVVVGKFGSLVATQNAAEAFATTEVADANLVFAENRVGVKLEVVGGIKTVTPPLPDEETEVADCAAGDVLTRGYDDPAGMLHVYLPNWTGGSDGFTCAGTDERRQSVIYLSAERHSATILVHEMGHALGLTLPGEGHSDDLPGFDPANVMASGYADTDDVWRRRFTVGQVVRMIGDSASWINWAKDAGGTLLRAEAAPHLNCQCGIDDPKGRCPRLIDDVARPRAGVGQLQSWRCGDRLQLPAVDLTEHPLALVAGRRWRAPPDECPLNLPGHWEVQFGAMYVHFENLTRSGKCPSWVAVFFEHHGPLYTALVGATGAWTDASEQHPLGGQVIPLVPVTVNVYYSPTLQESDVTSHIAEAMNVFGKDNRAGIDLKILHESTASCPAAPPGEFGVCLSSTAGSLPQLIGSALGVPTLTAPDQTNPAFKLNVMQPVASGGKLTLGQIFRIHAGLRTEGFPDCDVEPTRCPPVDADALP